VRFVRSGKGGRVFHLSRKEKQLLFETLKLYPLVPASHHRLSRGSNGPSADENQQLLEEALAEQRAENRRKILAMLSGRRRFRKKKSGFEFTLKRPQIEWLLQVFNDVRIGSWLALGEPGDEPEVTPRTVKYLIAMELGGMFESVLLSALGISESPEWLGD